MLSVLVGIMVLKVFVQGSRILFVAAGGNFLDYKNGYMWAISSSVSEFKEYLVDLEIFFQAYEYLVIIRLITLQKNKSLYQIYFDHNNRQLENRLYRWIAKKRHAQNCFLKDEVWVYLSFVLVTIAITIFEMLLIFYDTFATNDYPLLITNEHQFVLSIVSCVIYLLFLFAFVVFYNLLKKYHLFEFQRTKKYMIGFLLAFSVRAVIRTFEGIHALQKDQTQCTSIEGLIGGVHFLATPEILIAYALVYLK